MRETKTNYFQKKSGRWIKTTSEKIPSRSPSKIFSRSDGMHITDSAEYIKGKTGLFKIITRSRRMKD